MQIPQSDILTTNRLGKIFSKIWMKPCRTQESGSLPEFSIWCLAYSYLASLLRYSCWLGSSQDRYVTVLTVLHSNELIRNSYKFIERSCINLMLHERFILRTRTIFLRTYGTFLRSNHRSFLRSGFVATSSMNRNMNQEGQAVFGSLKGVKVVGKRTDTVIDVTSSTLQA